MRIHISPGLAAVVAYLLCALPCLGEVPQPVPKVEEPAIAYYPGGSVQMELGLSQDDLLPYAAGVVQDILKAGIPEKSSVAESLVRMLASVRSLNFLQMAVENPVDPQQIVGFYTRIPTSRNMTRVLRLVGDDGETTLLYSGPQGDGLFVLRMSQSSDAKPKWILQVGDLMGKIDYGALVELAHLRWKVTASPGPEAAASGQ